jgi:hypothetical protein
MSKKTARLLRDLFATADRVYISESGDYIKVERASQETKFSNYRILGKRKVRMDSRELKSIRWAYIYELATNRVLELKLKR